MERSNPTDIWFNVLLNSNLSDLDNLCSTNKQVYQLCNSPYFWLQKFKVDNSFMNNYQLRDSPYFWLQKFKIVNIPLIQYQTNFNSWINEYILILKTY